MRFFGGLLLLCLMLTGCQEGGKAHPAPNERPSAQEIVRVDAARPIPYHGTNHFQYSGLIEARQNTPLSFKTAGTVVGLFVQEGQYVKKGQLLARLDASDQQNTYDLAYQTQLQAQDAYNRMEPMYKNGTIPEIQWVEVETRLSQATIAANLAKNRIADTELYAPKSGFIGNKNIEVGANMLPSAAAFELLDIDAVYVNIPVPEGEVSKLERGQNATIEVAALNKELKGKVHLIGVAADRISHSYPVKILVSNPGHDLKPGMVCNTRLEGDNELNGWLISNKSLQSSPQGEQYVYVVRNNVAEISPVQTLDYINKSALVAGVSGEDLIVVSGQHKITQGAKVQLVNSKNQ
ncbi:MAG: efflux RND transporter periplasmic adaptor subunit [Mameliella sp.]|nr:efflux RND transporter periplasmic adaptor subunit [Phaeodactylibacter sp.]